MLKAILGLCWDDEVNTEGKRSERTTVMETVEVSWHWASSLGLLGYILQSRGTHVQSCSHVSQSISFLALACLLSWVAVIFTRKGPDTWWIQRNLSGRSTPVTWANGMAVSVVHLSGQLTQPSALSPPPSDRGNSWQCALSSNRDPPQGSFMSFRLFFLFGLWRLRFENVKAPAEVDCQIDDKGLASKNVMYFKIQLQNVYFQLHFGQRNKGLLLHHFGLPLLMNVPMLPFLFPSNRIMFMLLCPETRWNLVLFTF